MYRKIYFQDFDKNLKFDYNKIECKTLTTLSYCLILQRKHKAKKKSHEVVHHVPE